MIAGPFTRRAALRGLSLAAGALLASGAALGASRALGELAEDALRRAPVTAFAAPLAELVGLVLVIALARFWYARRAPAPADPLVVAAVCAASFVVAYARSLPREPAHAFGGVITPPPGETYRETYPARPKVLYRLNAHGFREPEWSERKEPGVVRVVLIGDSFVFGSGVPLDDTLSRSLEALLAARHPERRFEVVNLGMCGSNLASYVDVYETAQARLDPDFAVMCFIFPNDLSRWDDAVGRREARRPSLYSLGLFLLGRAAYTVWDQALLDREETAAGVTFLGEQLDRLDGIRSGHAELPLFLFSYRGGSLLTKAGTRPGVSVVPSPGEDRPERFIPGDGHPTGIGNRHFAELLLGAAEGTPRWRERVGAPR